MAKQNGYPKWGFYYKMVFTANNYKSIWEIAICFAGSSGNKIFARELLRNGDDTYANIWYETDLSVVR